MKKYLLALGTIALLFGGVAYASSVVPVNQGGTGSQSFTVNSLVISGATATSSLLTEATSTLTPSAPLGGSFTVVGSGGTLTCAGCLNSNSGDWAGTWQTFSPSHFQYAFSTSTLSASSPLTGSFIQVGSGGTLGIQAASASQAGSMAAVDYSLLHTATSTFTYPLTYTASTNAVTFPATSTLYGTGTGGQVLGWSNGIPAWVATSTGSTYTAAYPVTLTGSAFGLAFGTTTNNTWSASSTFQGQLNLQQASSTNITASGTVYANNFYDTNTAGSSCIGDSSGILENGNCVKSIASSGGTITVSSPTGAVNVDLALAHANTWTGLQTFSNASSTLLSGSTAWFTSFVGALTGNASTATALATPRAINGVNFDGTAAITIKAASSTLLGDNNTFSGLDTFSNATSTLFTSTTAWVGSLNLSGALNDSAASPGTNGYILQSTGSATKWIATSTLGLTSGGGQLLATYATSTPGSNVTVNFSGASGSAPSFSGSTLTLPSNTSYVTVETWGAGGGGSGGGSTGTGNGGAGGNSCFGTSSITSCATASGIIATSTGGGGGVWAGNGGAGGTGIGGNINITGGGAAGMLTDVNVTSMYASGSNGGSAGGGGGGGGISSYSSTGGVGAPFGGGGGGGGVDGVNNAGSGYGDGSGGGGGGYTKNLITSPSSTYYYSIGAGGSAGGTTGGSVGGAGGAGGVIISVYTTGISNGSVGSGTAGQFAFYNAADTNLSATSSIFSATNSFIGIGTSTPQHNLSVQTDIQDYGGKADYGTGGNTAIVCYLADGTLGHITITSLLASGNCLAN
jgi:hypothetical protein